MSLLEAYDESEEIVKAKDFVKNQAKLPSIAIITFKQDLVDIVDTNSCFEKYSTLSAGQILNIYKTTYKNKEIILYRTLIGGAATVGIMEEIIARGVKNFIFFGSCGTLSKNIKPGHFILPTEAYRDEGTSYHYLPVTDFIKVKTVDKLAKVFDKQNLKYIKTKTWTTDALYKETKNKMQNRKDAGCLVVDMECASIMAVSNVRNINSYQFFYSDDTLDGKVWDIRTLKDNRESVLEKCLEIALEVAAEI